MNPLELEMYHQIKNVIGVNPSFYEYIFMVDADTTVDEMSLNRLVSACALLCGKQYQLTWQNDARQEDHRRLRRNQHRKRQAVHRHHVAGQLL